MLKTTAAFQVLFLPGDFPAVYKETKEIPNHSLRHSVLFLSLPQCSILILYNIELLKDLLFKKEKEKKTKDRKQL